MAREMKRVLVVEDDRATASMIKYILRLEGFNVSVAHDVDEAMEMLGEYHPDIIVSDIVLPKIDGLAFARSVKKMYNVPIIFLTSLIGPKNRREGLAAGAIDYITKPFEPHDLIKRIKSALRA